MMVIIAIACLPLSLYMAIGEEKKTSTRQKTSPLNLSVREATCPPNYHLRNSFQTFLRLEPRARLALQQVLPFDHVGGYGRKWSGVAYH
ncbi:hypothetical protein BGX38DRAFT_1186514 [Terfezia claveryi]|nr:hypothetical protein BGX38DRAFT_1186514 [Terfezia claveryi]